MHRLGLIPRTWCVSMVDDQRKGQQQMCCKWVLVFLPGILTVSYFMCAGLSDTVSMTIAM